MDEILKKARTKELRVRKPKIKIFNVISLITSCISFALTIAIIIIYINVKTQYVEYTAYNNGKASSQFLYADSVHSISSNLIALSAVLVIPAIINIIIAFLHSPKWMLEVAEENLKLQKKIKVANMFGGLIFVNGILVLLMMWRNKWSTTSFLMQIALPAATLMIVPTVVQITTNDSLEKPLNAFESMVEDDSLISVDRNNRKIEINLKLLSQKITDESLGYKFVTPPRKIMFEKTEGQQKLLQIWTKSSKVLNENYGWKEKEVLFCLNWDEKVKDIHITKAMDEVINAIIKSVSHKLYKVSYQKNLNLRSISGERSFASKAENVLCPNKQ